MQEAKPTAFLKVAKPLANRIIWIFSSIVLLAVVVLNRVQIPSPEGLDVHVFARINAVLNSLVSMLLVAGLISARSGRWNVHRKVMLSAMALSGLFLVSYILHHLFAGETRFGGVGGIRVLYYVVLATHILLAAGSLPFILLTAYRALSGHYPEHRKMARRVWPVWFYVSVSGVLVFWLISPYY